MHDFFIFVLRLHSILPREKTKAFRKFCVEVEFNDEIWLNLGSFAYAFFANGF